MSYCELCVLTRACGKNRRMAQYYPELIRAVFSICTPFIPMSTVKHSLEDVVKRRPHFRYQLQLASPVAENIVNKSPENLRGFINGIFGGRTPEGKPAFSVDVGVIEENVARVEPSPLVSREMIDFYVQEYSRNGLHGPTNWYRTRALNADDEQEQAKNGEFKFPMPAMLVVAEKDAALPAAMAEGQEKHFAGGLKQEIIPGSGHWVLVQCPELANKHIGDFIKSVLGDELKASL